MEVTEGLKTVFETKEDVFILTSSGHGGDGDGRRQHPLPRRQGHLTINAGKFGERWGNICKAYGIAYKDIVLEWGNDLHQGSSWPPSSRPIPASRPSSATLSETSTGAVYDIKGFGEVVAATEPSSSSTASRAGRHALPDGRMEDRRPRDRLPEVLHDPARAGLHRLQPQGLEGRRDLQVPEVLFRRQEGQEEPGQQDDALDARHLARSSSRRRPWTSSRAMGLEKLFEHHRILGDATRAGVKAIGLELLAEKPGQHPDRGQDPRRRRRRSRSSRPCRASTWPTSPGAQDPNKGKFFRIAHLGLHGRVRRHHRPRRPWR